MPESSGLLWLRQAEGDIAVGDLLQRRGERSMNCHAIAKYQQGVEKSIKAIVAELKTAGIVGSGPSMRHDLARDVSILKRMKHGKMGTDIVSQIKVMLDTATRTEIAWISGLAPRGPVGGLQPRNTEYPFQATDGSWRVPADEDSFTTEEVGRARLIARRVYERGRRIVSAMSRVR